MFSFHSNWLALRGCSRSARPRHSLRSPTPAVAPHYCKQRYCSGNSSDRLLQCSGECVTDWGDCADTCNLRKLTAVCVANLDIHTDYA